MALSLADVNTVAIKIHVKIVKIHDSIEFSLKPIQNQ